MKATRLLSWLEHQSYEMSQLNTILLQDNDLRSDIERYEFFQSYFNGQPIGDMKAGFFVYMYFTKDQYYEYQGCFAHEVPAFIIPVDDDVILFHQIDRL